jgi:peptide/nickel transport system substrate-binding protein
LTEHPSQTTGFIIRDYYFCLSQPLLQHSMQRDMPMKGPMRARLIATAVLTTTALAGALIPAASTSAQHAKATPIYLNTYQNFKTTMVRNFNLFDPAGRMDFTDFGVYEPLMIVNVPPGAPGKIYPWLATGYTWSNGNKTLTFTIRSGVKWSDGQPFTAQDVAFTLNYGKAHPVADQQGLFAKPAQLTSVTASGSKVTFNFTDVNTTVFRKVANLTLIIPQHIYSKVADPSTFQNSTPVGTGPFTEVTDFTPQGFTYAKNPYYWQKLAYDGVHVSSYDSNNSALLANSQGQLDQTGNFIPNCEKVYAAKDSAHFHCDYTTVGPVALWMNDQQYPYSIPDFRKAVSMSIDRQKIYKIGEYGYEPPSDALGVLGPWPNWADPSLSAQAKALATYNPAKAKATLVAAKFTYKGNALYDPNGKPVSLTLNVINGWSDWDTSMQILQGDLKAIGIDASINLMTQPAWFDGTGKGTLPGGDAQFHWVNTTNTPYDYLFGFMSQESFTPVGTDATLNGQDNFERYVSTDATALLKQFRETSDAAKQHKLMNQVEAIFLKDLPIIPVVYSADWSTYSTLHFTGWPTNDNRYTSSSVNDVSMRLKVWTSLKPVQ